MLKRWRTTCIEQSPDRSGLPTGYRQHWAGIAEAGSCSLGRGEELGITLASRRQAVVRDQHGRLQSVGVDHCLPEKPRTLDF